ncbi:MAG TPA: cation-translocating P-type ATPase, partial [Vicinamibacterales bacterium]|nr:cation-translocating P-type ATPase [Vicinamibacterales bacterium]
MAAAATPDLVHDARAESRPWHSRGADEALRELESGHAGLSRDKARRRLEAHGPNELRAASRVTPWQLLAGQFKNVLIVILLVATALSAALGHVIEAVAITVIVVFAVVLGFAQEFRAERAIEALQEMAAPRATVVRDGTEIELAAREVVPGDLLVLTAGNRVAADGRLLQSVNLKLQEAALTGESTPVEKHAGPLHAVDAPVGDRRNMVYAGTSVAYGRGLAVVVATGHGTEFGRIAQMLLEVEPSRTPLQANLDRLGRQLARAALAVVAVIVALGLARGQPFVEMLVFGIALAVAVVPEALPAVVTISLALGVQRLVRRRALMRRLAAVETLGSTSVICTDKTGTLTRDEMTVRRLYVGGRFVDVTGSGYGPEGTFSVDSAALHVGARELGGLGGLVRDLLEAGARASDAHLVRENDHDAWTIKGDPTEGALVVAAAKAGLNKAELDAAWPRVHEIPFSAESKRMTTLHAAPAGTIAFAKGAPEVLLATCIVEQTPAGCVALDGSARARILEAARGMADDALRVLAVAVRRDATPVNAESGLTLIGLVGMSDPPRVEAQAAIETCERAGIRVVMITGDHPVTARAIARELGLLKGGRVVTGVELGTLDDAALEREVGGIDVYARVSPADKMRIVEALQKSGHVVAMTGDGVNDAPALKKADIGIAMGVTGTDVAREAAAMTLTDDNFASIVAAVEEGRGIFGNIKKYLMFLLSSNVGEIGLMAGTALLDMPLPLTAVQILYVNLATDGLPALALAVDPPEPDLMRRPPRDPHSGIFGPQVVALMLVGGAWSMCVNVALFAWALHSGRPLVEAMSMTFVSLVLIQFLKAYSYRSDRASVLRRPFANRWLNAAVAWEVTLLALIIYLPVLQGPFSTFGLTAADWAIVLGVSATV